MALNIATIVPALEKAKNIATEAYADTSISTGVSDAINAAQVYTDTSTASEATARATALGLLQTYVDLNINDADAAFAVINQTAIDNALAASSYTDTQIATNTTEIDGGRITTDSIDALALKANTISSREIQTSALTVDVLNFSNIENRTAFSAKIGLSLLEYNGFIKDFFALANSGDTGGLLEYSWGGNICVDHYLYYSVHRFANTVRLWVYGTNPSGVVGANCGGSQGKYFDIVYTDAQRNASTSINGGVSVPTNDPIYGLDFNFSFSYTDFYDVPTSPSPVQMNVYGGSGALNAYVSGFIMGAYAAPGDGYLDHNNPDGSFSINVGKVVSKPSSSWVSTSTGGSNPEAWFDMVILGYPIGTYKIKIKMSQRDLWSNWYYYYYELVFVSMGPSDDYTQRFTLPPYGYPLNYRTVAYYGDCVKVG